MCLFQQWFYNILQWRLAKKKREKGTATPFGITVPFSPYFLLFFLYFIIIYNNYGDNWPKKKGRKKLSCLLAWQFLSPLFFLLFFCHIYYVILLMTQFSYNINYYKFHVKAYHNISWLKQGQQTNIYIMTLFITDFHDFARLSHKQSSRFHFAGSYGGNIRSDSIPSVVVFPIATYVTSWSE